jgi:hypothetical protein
MKNRILIAAISLILFTACSKSKDDVNNGGDIIVVDASAVPASTRAALNTNFPGATQVEWSRSSSSNSSFSCQFNHNSQRHSTTFDDNGRQSSHSVICIDGAVPDAVLTAFRQRFPSDNVYEWKLRNDGTWKAHFLRNGVKYEATYTATGTLLKFEQSQ